MADLPKGRVLGIDAGTVRTGIAVSDETGFLARAVCTVKAKGRRELVSKIVEQANEHSVRLIVMGHPINMNGTLGESSERIMKLAESIREKTDIPVVLFDERCTTMAAAQILNLTDTGGQKRKDIIDALSAEIILQNYLDSESRSLS